MCQRQREMVAVVTDAASAADGAVADDSEAAGAVHKTRRRFVQEQFYSIFLREHWRSLATRRKTANLTPNTKRDAGFDQIRWSLLNDFKVRGCRTLSDILGYAIGPNVTTLRGCKQ
jgi:hypothetical protein